MVTKIFLLPVHTLNTFHYLVAHSGNLLSIAPTNKRPPPIRFAKIQLPYLRPVDFGRQCKIFVSDPLYTEKGGKLFLIFFLEYSKLTVMCEAFT